MTIQELDQSMADICSRVPLGMSQFQMNQMVLRKVGDARTYRQIVMELHKRYQALKEAEFRKKKFDAEIALKQSEIEEEPNQHKRTILIVEIEEKQYYASMEEILIRDAVLEVTSLQKALDSMPQLTRDQFEKDEPDYWRKNLILQARREMIGMGAVSPGTLETLEALGMQPEQVTLEIKQSIENNLTLLAAK